MPINLLVYGWSVVRRGGQDRISSRNNREKSRTIEQRQGQHGQQREGKDNVLYTKGDMSEGDKRKK